MQFKLFLQFYNFLAPARTEKVLLQYADFKTHLSKIMMYSPLTFVLFVALTFQSTGKHNWLFNEFTYQSFKVQCNVIN